MIPNTLLSTDTYKFLHIPNVAYHTALKLGGATLFYKPNVYLGTSLYAPPGANYWNKVLAGKVIPSPQFTQITDYSLPYALRDEQIPIFKTMLTVRHGLIEFTTGGGKTVIMVSYHKIRNKPTLIVCHAKDMVLQTYNEFKKFLGPEYPVGRYNSDYKELDFVTVTTFATFTKSPDIFKDFDILIIDEADAYFTDKARARICLHPATHKFGFTGTIRTASDEFKKADDATALEKFWGIRIGGTYTKQPVSSINYWYYSKTYRDEWNTPITPHGDWTLFRSGLDEDQERKDAMVDYITRIYENGDRLLVLFDRVNDVDYFSSMFLGSHRIHGTINKSTRERSKDEFLTNGGILFAQYKTASRGVDYPECNKVAILFPIKNESTLRQAVGRAIRFMPGKTSHVYDFVDSSLDFQWNKRKKTYEAYYKLKPQPIE